ncbi:DUF1206 domain-containing protein [Bifidobacterium sp. ESL0764]|uniref:DUF1206 domain-containing protein n=1 Tax=Bifidobacterium sp. ESL0764 TaxID=2983228 RepID=UPI0023F7E19B|nr:DUF1206 domain-containing protein [Bifidobacterium sp. ESL0764]WEV65819.1 DUF1206 domain-containing protein [Bifidobacterium sp. ESL0764]
MMLRINKDQLQSLLRKHGTEIGNGKYTTYVVNLIAAVFYAVSAWQAPSPWLRYVLLIIAVALLIWNAVQLFKVHRNDHFDAEVLYKEIEKMDITEKRSSIIAVRDASGPFKNRYLVYHDQDWDCEFFPNHRTIDEAKANKKALADYLSNNFEIPEDSFKLERVGAGSNRKPSTEHNGEMRYYDYTIYLADVAKIPPQWSAGSFTVGSKDCKWMTIDEMMADKRIRKINQDVIGLVRNYAS